MAAKAYFTVEADQDLTAITIHIAQDNPAAAFDWIEATRNLCELIAAHPELGELTRTVRFGGIRRHVSGNYVIFYRLGSSGVEILRVFHGARELDRLL